MTVTTRFAPSPTGRLHVGNIRTALVCWLAARAAGCDADAARREYDALFIGIARGELVPYASYYITGFLHERPLARLSMEMEELGRPMALTLTTWPGGRTRRLAEVHPHGSSIGWLGS